MILVDVHNDSGSLQQLYDLLAERDPEVNISHKEMPTFSEHCGFVLSHPYAYWYLILKIEHISPPVCVGSIYLTDQREIGIAIFKNHQGFGYGSDAVKELMKMHPGKFYANISPHNPASVKFFKQFGAKHIQNTYVLGDGK